MEPEWEAKFETNSFGFRPGRSCHDAIEAVFSVIKLQPKYVLEADIAQCFNRISHSALLLKVNTFPLLERLLRAWLKAGVIDEGQLVPTEEGTPQGGCGSPLLMNIALHGLETSIRQAFPGSITADGKRLQNWKPMVNKSQKSKVKKISYGDATGFKPLNASYGTKPKEFRARHVVQDIKGTHYKPLTSVMGMLIFDF